MLNIEWEKKLAVKKRRPKPLIANILVYCRISLSYNIAFQCECDYY